MAKQVFLYGPDETRTFLFPTGEIASPEVMKKQFPAISVEPQMVEVQGHTIMAVQDFNVMRDFYKIDPALNEQEALAAIEEALNAPPPEPEASPEEIEAAAAVLEALNGQPDNPQD